MKTYYWRSNLMSLTSEMRRIAKEDINDIVSMLNEDGFKTSVVRMESDPEEIEEKITQKIHSVLKINGIGAVIVFPSKSYLKYVLACLISIPVSKVGKLIAILFSSDTLA